MAEVFRCLAAREHAQLARACFDVTEEQRYMIAVRLGIISELDDLKDYLGLTTDVQVARIVQWAEDQDPGVKVLRLQAEFVEFRIMVAGVVTDMRRFEAIFKQKQELEARVVHLTEMNTTLLRVIDQLTKSE